LLPSSQAILSQSRHRRTIVQDFPPISTLQIVRLAALLTLPYVLTRGEFNQVKATHFVVTTGAGRPITGQQPKRYSGEESNHAAQSSASESSDQLLPEPGAGADEEHQQSQLDCVSQVHDGPRFKFLLLV
jgi:hypothetical protein